MKKIDEGETITNIGAYGRKVAYYIFLEECESTLLTELDDDLPVPSPDTSTDDSEDQDARFDCFDKCLAELPPESRHLIVEYYQGEKKTKKETRRALAKQLGIPLNALRIRAHRIRKALEQCIQTCMAP
jgi:RNA polymerase sigma factor (sigma-70 family)